MWISSTIKKKKKEGEYAGVIEYYGLEKHDCKQSVCTKCSLFDQWTQLISELAGGTGHFDKGAAKRQKILDPPFCWSSKTREQMGHTQKHRHYCFLCYPPEEES